MTPLQINMLLHFYGRAAPWTEWHSAQKEAFDYFVGEQLIEPNDKGGWNLDAPFKLTERGVAYVRFLCALPLPVANWTIPGPWAPSHPSERSMLDRLMDQAAERGRNA